MTKNKSKYLIIILILFAFGLVGCTNKTVFNDDSSNITNKTIVGNYYLVENNWLLGKFSKLIPDDKMTIYSDAINKLSEIANEQGKETYFISTPHKTNMLKHLYPEFVNNKENIDLNKNLLKSQLDENKVSFIDIDEYFLNMFSDTQRENFFFKTDHHWNGIGAFEGFKFIIENINLRLSSEELDNYFNQYKTISVKDKEFIGSYNRKLDFIVKEKEFANYVYKDGAKYEYFISDGNKDKKIKEKHIIATLKNKDSWDYGGAYMRGTNCNILKIRNNNSLSNKKVLVFRDSYQAPMTWLLADVFNEVEIIDPRYIENINMTYKQIIENSNTDIVMFMYNSFGFEGMIEEMINKGIE